MSSYSNDLLVEGAVSIGREVARTYVDNGAYERARDAHGAGALAVTFAETRELIDVVEEASDAVVTFCNVEACERLGDVALGAVTRDRESARPVVVVDCVEARLRVVVRGVDDRRPSIDDDCDLGFVRVEAQRVVEMSDDRAAQLSEWARQRAASLDASERLMFVGVDAELCQASDLDVVRADQFEHLSTLIAEAGVERPRQIEQLRDKWQAFDAQRLCMLWIFSVAKQRDVDSFWFTERQVPHDKS